MDKSVDKKSLSNVRGSLIKMKKEIESLSIPEFLDEDTFAERMEAKTEINARINSVNAEINAYKRRFKI